MNENEMKPADVWPFCATCLQREICDEARRHNAPYHVLSYCCAELVRALEEKGRDGSLFLFPEALVIEIFRAMEHVSGASGALRRLAYLHVDLGPAMFPEKKENPHESRR